MPTSTELIPRTTIVDICTHRDAAMARAAEAVEIIARGHRLAQEAQDLAQLAHGASHFGLRDHAKAQPYERMLMAFDPAASLESFRQHLDARTWVHAVALTGMDTLMDRTAKEQLDADLAGKVPVFSEESARQVFESLLGDAQLIFQRGLARTFSELDRRFRSHDAFRIGARVILTNVFDEYGSFNYHSRMRETITDVERVFAILDGKVPNPGDLVRAIAKDRQGRGYGAHQSVTETEYFRIRCFQNGNAHLWLLRDDLVDKANLTLADYYGEVLPDAAEPADSPADLRSKSGLPAKDLSFYPTPSAVVERAIRDIHVNEKTRALEPSAGEGNMVRHLLAQGARVDAVEIHPDRAATLARMHHPRLSVLEANFLTLPASPIYDLVLMNPPFYGVHWMEHVVHAWGFVKPRGVLVAVLPITAELGESAKHETFREWVKRETGSRGWRNPFTDLPAESFAASGTKINTVLLTMHKG